jgi:GMP synthase PP-ATPase subunit
MEAELYWQTFLELLTPNALTTATEGGLSPYPLATILSIHRRHRAIGDLLTCMFIDQRFIFKLDGITDPEEKRKLIGAEFIRVFEEESKRLGPFDPGCPTTCWIRYPPGTIEWE